MHTLVLSIACSVAVSVLLKLARSHRIDVGQAIAMNYVIASTLCVVLFRPTPTSLLTPATPWWVLIALGVLLPTIFLAMAAAVRHAGIVLSDAAQRLSLFIPLMASFLLFGEALSAWKAAGIAVALVALVLLLIRRPQPDRTAAPDGATPAVQHAGPDAAAPAHGNAGVQATAAASNGSQAAGKAVFYLLCVWVGYGVIDILFKQLAKSGAAFANSLLVTFVLAGIIIFSSLFVRRTRWDMGSIKAGVLLGLLNFGNIYFYVSAHQRFPENPTLVFSAMNIGVISVGTLVGAGFFKERLSRFNVAGIALAIVAIVLLIPR
ncbi:MAG TPA: EamA/RhaT family transporter [Burkholderiaceae bacterium]|nr:EamA/RhaT family transporter [Burkholderiaceae bacterium]